MPPGSPSAEDAAVAGVRLVDLSDRAKLRLRGADRLRFLNGQVTNDVRRADAEMALYACVLTAKGKLCADVFITAGDDFLQLDAAPELREPLLARLDRYLVADDVEIEDVTDEFGLLHLLPAVAAEGEGEKCLLPAEIVWAAVELRSVGATRFGVGGCDLFVARAALAEFRADLAKTFPLLDTAAAEARRIAAGVPRWGAELDENTLLPEAGLEARAVDYDKGCYVGQEIVSRLKSVGHVNRNLRRLRGESPTLPPPGAPLYPAEGGSGTPVKEVGRLTSVAPALDPALGWVALGYVRRGHEAPGVHLRVGDGGGDENSVEVAGPPFSVG